MSISEMQKDGMPEYSSKELFMAYRGVLSGEIISCLLQLADSHIKQLGPVPRRRKNVINILIECLQNIYYHGTNRTHFDASRDNAHLECYVSLSQAGEDIVITTRNIIGEQQKEKLSASIDALNELSPEALYHHYLEVLDKGMLSPEGGAGLGLIRIIRESGSRIEAEFIPENDRWAFVCQVRIGSVFNAVQRPTFVHS
jgi:hypothetical protein